MSRRKNTTVILLLAIAAGCGRQASEKPANLYAVSGVVTLSGGQPLTTGGMIEFRSVQDSKIRSISSIDDQGRFTLSSRVGDKSYPGAQPGTYVVTVIPKADKYVEPIEYAKKVKVETQDNTVTVKLGVVQI